MSHANPTGFKRLCIFSDGTWNTPEMEVPTNIYILATAIKQKDSNGIPQIVYYDPGLGTEGSMIDQIRGGAFGEGIDLNIQQLYTFIALNYEDGDEILLFGFSRGAYTVRSLAGLINESGLVFRDKLNYVKEAYDLYRQNKDPNSKVAQRFRAKHSRRVPIKLMVCFDTVGALGLPLEPPLGLSFLFDQEKYRFHDTKLSKYIEHAIHPLSIDEDRKSFLPTHMTPHPKRGPSQVTEKFFPGYHGGVGGGNKLEKPLAANALLHVIEEMERRGIGLECHRELLPHKMNRRVRGRSRDPFRYRVIRFVTGQKARTIESLDMLHPSVYTRYKNVPEWRPAALERFRTKLEG